MGSMMPGTGANEPPIWVHFWAARSHHHVASWKGNVKGVMPLGTEMLAIAEVSMTHTHDKNGTAHRIEKASEGVIDGCEAFHIKTVKPQPTRDAL